MTKRMSLDDIAHWLQQEGEELLYTPEPQGAPLDPPPSHLQATPPPGSSPGQALDGPALDPDPVAPEPAPRIESGAGSGLTRGQASHTLLGYPRRPGRCYWEVQYHLPPQMTKRVDLTLPLRRLVCVQVDVDGPCTLHTNDLSHPDDTWHLSPRLPSGTSILIPRLRRPHDWNHFLFFTRDVTCVYLTDAQRLTRISLHAELLDAEPPSREVVSD